MQRDEEGLLPLSYHTAGATSLILNAGPDDYIDEQSEGFENYASNTSDIMKVNNYSRDLSYDHLVTYSNGNLGKSK